MVEVGDQVCVQGGVVEHVGADGAHVAKAVVFFGQGEGADPHKAVAVVYAHPHFVPLLHLGEGDGVDQFVFHQGLHEFEEVFGCVGGLAGSVEGAETGVVLEADLLVFKVGVGVGMGALLGGFRVLGEVGMVHLQGCEEVVVKGFVVWFGGDVFNNEAEEIVAGFGVEAASARWEVGF